MKRERVFCAIAAYCLLAATPSLALTTECRAVQDCVDASIPAAQSACVAASPGCDNRGNDERFSVTASQLADRAIALKHCDAVSFERRGVCNACYVSAKAPLESRYRLSLFRGLLGTATSIIEDRRKSSCDSLPIGGSTTPRRPRPR